MEKKKKKEMVIGYSPQTSTINIKYFNKNMVK